MAVFFSDTFDESIATAITSHAPNVGGAYTHPSISSGAAGTVGAGTGRVAFPGGGVYAVENAATPGAADYTVTGSLQWDGADGRMDGLARLTGGNSGYVFFAKFDGSIAIFRYDSGTLNGPLVSGTHTGTNGFTEYAFSYSVNGSALSFTFNGATVTTTDATYSAAGKVGFAGREASFYGISANDTTVPADTTPPTITGPGGSANGPFGISTAENTTAVGTFTASESVTWSKTGTDQALFSLGTTSTTATVSWASAPNFEGIGTNPKTFTLTATDGAGNARSVTINVTVTNVNEAPSFSGTITVPTLTQGVAMTPIALGGFFTDPEGASLSYALVGSWPAGLSISGGSIQGTPTGSGSFSGLTVTATDGTNSPVSSNAIGFTVNASGGGGDTTPPVITGPGGATGASSSVSVPENTTAVHTFTANEAVTWSINGGADAARFNISGGGALAFLAAPDFEAATDADTNNTYIVGVRAVDGAGNATTQICTVTVTNVVEPTSFSALTDPIAESGINLANGTTVFWTWYPSGRPGAAAAGVDGSSTVNAQGRALISHTVAGAGLVVLGRRPGPAVSNDRLFAQFLTLA